MIPSIVFKLNFGVNRFLIVSFTSNDYNDNDDDYDDDDDDDDDDYLVL